MLNFNQFIKMKTISNFFIAFLVTAISSAAFGQSDIVNAHIKVYGNCTMCKKRIETALDRKGIKQANWDPRTKDLAVVYNKSKISEDKIHEIVAAAGHDTEKVKAPDEVYSKLPFCCLYRETDGGDKHQR